MLAIGEVTSIAATATTPVSKASPLQYHQWVEVGHTRKSIEEGNELYYVRRSRASTNSMASKKTEWHVHPNWGHSGPYTATEIKNLAAAGRISPDTLVWRTGLSDWVQAKRVRGLEFRIQPHCEDDTTEIHEASGSEESWPFAASQSQGGPPHAAPPTRSVDEDGSQQSGRAIFAYLLLAVSGFYIGGWSIVWGQFGFYTLTSYTNNYIFSYGVFAFRINDRFYGIRIVDRFFDSPLLSFICIGVSWVAVAALFRRITR